MEKLKTIRSKVHRKIAVRVPADEAAVRVETPDWHYTTKSVWKKYGRKRV